ncbi:MAG TPA: hypothetical protein VNR89_01215 [Roseomonas sp.]|nr:hypothetical protein [Roseomonas sp.]
MCIGMGQDACFSISPIDAEDDPAAQCDDISRHIFGRDNLAAFQFLDQYSCSRIPGAHPQTSDFVEHEVVSCRDDDIAALNGFRRLR